MELLLPVGSHTHVADVSSATTITIATGATSVLIQCYSQNIYVTLDGSTPSSTNGFILFTTDGARRFDVGGTKVIKVLQVAATATVDYQCVKVVSG